MLQVRTLPLLAIFAFAVPGFAAVPDPANGGLETEGIETLDGYPLEKIPAVGGGTLEELPSPFGIDPAARPQPQAAAEEGLVAQAAAPIDAAPIDRTGWTATSDSFQAGNDPGKVLDGDANSIFHSEYSPNLRPLPHHITIDMKQTYQVNSLTYLPRQDGSRNGNVGRHTIQLSSDGIDFRPPVAIGTYLDDSTQKTSIWATEPARYVRLTALTEAGGRGPWMSVAEINIFRSTVSTPSPAGVGRWSPTIDFPLVPVAAGLMHDTGKLLLWSSYSPITFGGSGLTQTATYDPTGQIVSQRTVTETGHDMFCPGTSIDFTGRFIITGGSNAAKTTIYRPSSDGYTTAADMKIARGYQSQTTLSDGRVFVIGGSWSGGAGNKNGEIYDVASNTWTVLPGCPVAPMLTNDAQGVYRADNHGWLFAWKGGSVFHAGPSRAMNWYGTTGSGSRTTAGLRANDVDSMNGDAVMYDAVNGKILTLGGAPSYQDSSATTNVHVITIGDPGTIPTVARVGSMAFARAYANAVVLPDGKVFVAGGQTFAKPFNDDNAILIPEIWNPATSSFTAGAPMAVPRTYHSVGILMADATVFVGGGGLCGGCSTNHFDAQVYSPPYLFTSGGSRAARPVITSMSSATVRVGGSFTATTNTGVTSFSLVRYSTVTHTVNTDQRRIPVTPTASGLTYTIRVPSDPGISLPGYWLVFALDSAGVPSVARTIQITL
jgi:galactose oxidase